MGDRIIEWVNGTRLMQLWQLMPGELLQLCRKGWIQAYYYKTITFDTKCGRTELIDWTYEKWSPCHQDQLEYAWFNLDDKNQFEKEHPEIIPPLSDHKEAQPGKRRAG